MEETDFAKKEVYVLSPLSPDSSQDTITDNAGRTGTNDNRPAEI